MAHLNAAKKDMRKNAKRREQNKTATSAMRTAMKKVLTAVEKKDVEGAKQALLVAMKRIDKAAKIHVIHTRNASRKKSLLARQLNAILKAS